MESLKRSDRRYWTAAYIHASSIKIRAGHNLKFTTSFHLNLFDRCKPTMPDSAIMDPPPSYEEAMKIIERLKANPPSAKALTAAHKEMANVAGSPATSTALLAEVEKLAGAANQIDASFQKVTVALVTVDKNDYKRKDGSPEPKLAPGWQMLQDVLCFCFVLSFTLSASHTIIPVGMEQHLLHVESDRHERRWLL